MKVKNSIQNVSKTDIFFVRMSVMLCLTLAPLMNIIHASELKEKAYTALTDLYILIRDFATPVFIVLALIILFYMLFICKDDRNYKTAKSWLGRAAIIWLCIMSLPTIVEYLGSIFGFDVSLDGMEHDMESIHVEY